MHLNIGITQSNTSHIESMISIIQQYCIFSIAQIAKQETHPWYGFLPYYGQVFIKTHLKHLFFHTKE